MHSPLSWAGAFSVDTMQEPFEELAAARQQPRQLPPSKTQSFQDRLAPQPATRQTAMQPSQAMQPPAAMQQQAYPQQSYQQPPARSRDPRSRRYAAGPPAASQVQVILFRCPCSLLAVNANFCETCMKLKSVLDKLAIVKHQQQHSTGTQGYRSRGSSAQRPPSLRQPDDRTADRQPESAASSPQRQQDGGARRASPDDMQARQAIADARRQRLREQESQVLHRAATWNHPAELSRAVGL